MYVGSGAGVLRSIKEQEKQGVEGKGLWRESLTNLPYLGFGYQKQCWK
jgi:hypothetical protein